MLAGRYHLFLPLKEEVVNYVDDFGGGADTPEELCDKFDKFLTLMETINAKFNPRKVKMGCPSITCVVFEISESGYKPKENQLTKFKDPPFPTRDKLRAWFGLLNTIPGFHPEFTGNTCRLLRCPKEKCAMDRNGKMIQAFNKAKDAVSRLDILTFPKEDKDLYLDADASQLGCGAILYHLADDGMTKFPIRFMPHVFTTAAQKWSTIEKECAGRW
jgi:hypothetical protein